MKFPCPTEHAEQCTVIRWFDLQYPDLCGRLAAVPNGGDRHGAVAGKLKAEGVRSGFPDLILLTPRQGFYGLAIEMKRQRGGTLSAEQDGWLNFLAEQGYMAVVCKGAQAAIDTIQSYLGVR